RDQWPSKRRAPQAHADHRNQMVEAAERMHEAHGKAAGKAARRVRLGAGTPCGGGQSSSNPAEPRECSLRQPRKHRLNPAETLQPLHGAARKGNSVCDGGRSSRSTPSATPRVVPFTSNERYTSTAS